MDEEISRIIRLANEFYGAFFAFKNYHIRTLSGKLHETCDEVGEDLFEWADTLLERAFGIIDQRPDSNIIKPIQPNPDNTIESNVVEILKVLKAKTLALRDYLSSSRFVGIVSELENIVSKLDWYTYIIRLS